MDTPLASRLLGKTLGDWTVIEKIKKDNEDNSGYFSTCYYVEDKDNRKAFLKAYNYVYAFKNKASSADALKFMSNNFIYERDLLKYCFEHKMKRVVAPIDSGEYTEPDEIIPVPYLIFEIASGNLKNKKFVGSDLVWKLTAFHGGLVGLQQLHRSNIVHQDIKPSNILIFGINYSRISDLGSATQLNNKSYWEFDDHPGDLRYAPIELLYGYCSSDWDTRRYGADLFMMGGILTYMLTQSNFLALLISKLPETHKPHKFGGKFEEVKPYLIDSYNDTLGEISSTLPKKVAKEIMIVISELTNPIPDERGNPQKYRRVHKQFSLQRYISLVDKIVKYPKYYFQ